jgi:hypothetical protein
MKVRPRSSSGLKWGQFEVGWFNAKTSQAGCRMQSGNGSIVCFRLPKTKHNMEIWLSRVLGRPDVAERAMTSLASSVRTRCVRMSPCVSTTPHHEPPFLRLSEGKAPLAWHETGSHHQWNLRSGETSALTPVASSTGVMPPRASDNMWFKRKMTQNRHSNQKAAGVPVRSMMPLDDRLTSPIMRSEKFWCWCSGSCWKSLMQWRQRMSHARFPIWTLALSEKRQLGAPCSRTRSSRALGVWDSLFMP